MVILLYKQLITRKPHRCAWCREVITAGETAVFRKGRYEGDFFSEHLHPECDAGLNRSGDEPDGYPSMEQKRGKSYEESQEE